jgi:hypothetical protein
MQLAPLFKMAGYSQRRSESAPPLLEALGVDFCSYTSSSSVMAPFFANRSCDPFQPRSYQCVIGTYVQYAINISCAADVAAGIKFATQKNIRLVVRNTGHGKQQMAIPTPSEFPD